MRKEPVRSAASAAATRLTTSIAPTDDACARGDGDWGEGLPPVGATVAVAPATPGTGVPVLAGKAVEAGLGGLIRMRLLSFRLFPMSTAAIDVGRAVGLTFTLRGSPWPNTTARATSSATPRIAARTDRHGRRTVAVVVDGR